LGGGVWGGTEAEAAELDPTIKTSQRIVAVVDGCSRRVRKCSSTHQQDCSQKK
jgi:hypothetical protein